MSIDVKQLEQEYLSIVPRIRDRAEYVLRSHLPKHEREDMVQDVLLASWQDVLRMAEKGISCTSCWSVVAKWAIADTVSKWSSRSDVMSHLEQEDDTENATQFNHGNTGHIVGRSPIVRNDRDTTRDHSWQDSVGNWRDWLTSDSRFTPADIAAARHDWQLFFESLTCQLRRVAEMLASGEHSAMVACKLGLSRARLCQLRARVRQLWESANA